MYLYNYIISNNLKKYLALYYGCRFRVMDWNQVMIESRLNRIKIFRIASFEGILIPNLLF